MEELNYLDNIEIQKRLWSMYNNEPQMGVNNTVHQIDTTTRILPNTGKELFDLYTMCKPHNSLEIGLAYGFSTLNIIAAITKNGFGTHTAIDPTQNSYWNGIGYRNAKDFLKDFKFHQGLSCQVLPKLQETSNIYDFIFIDGNHRFDDVLVDFYLCNSLCSVDGYIVLDDFLMPSIQTVVKFIKSNYYDSYTYIESAAINLAIFQKNRHDSRAWDHFVQF